MLHKLGGVVKDHHGAHEAHTDGGPDRQDSDNDPLGLMAALPLPAQKTPKMKLRGAVKKVWHALPRPTTASTTTTTTDYFVIFTAE